LNVGAAREPHNANQEGDMIEKPGADPTREPGEDDERLEDLDAPGHEAEEVSGGMRRQYGTDPCDPNRITTTVSCAP
jgi:hypothetical protein